MRALRAILFVLALIATQGAARAHQLDEYVQSTFVEITPKEIRLSIHMTPGAEVAKQLWAAIDSNKDGEISAAEASRYALVVGEDLQVDVDHRQAGLMAGAGRFPEFEDVREGTGIVQLEFFVIPDSLGEGTHTLTFSNKHMPKISAYLFAATMPKSEAVKILRQTRNKNQSAGEIEFSIAESSKKPPADSSGRIGLVILFGVIVLAMIGAILRGRVRG